MCQKTVHQKDYFNFQCISVDEIDQSRGVEIAGIDTRHLGITSHHPNVTARAHAHRHAHTSVRHTPSVRVWCTNKLARFT